MTFEELSEEKTKKKAGVSPQERADQEEATLRERHRRLPLVLGTTTLADHASS